MMSLKSEDIFMNATQLIQHHPHIILFDGVCNLCAAWVQFVVARDPALNTFLKKYASQQQKRQLSRVYIALDNREQVADFPIAGNNRKVAVKIADDCALNS
jgi:predicted DCC family thiol-disulfide oxidoreductase YuxK